MVWPYGDVCVTLSKERQAKRGGAEHVRLCPLWEFSQIREKTVRSCRNVDPAERRSVRFSLLCELSITQREKDALCARITGFRLLSMLCTPVA